MELTVTKVVNGKNLYAYTGQGADIRECLDHMPEMFRDAVYREADERVCNLNREFAYMDFPLSDQLEGEYEKAIDGVLDDALWFYCDCNCYQIKVKEVPLQTRTIIFALDNNTGTIEKKAVFINNLSAKESLIAYIMQNKGNLNIWSYPEHIDGITESPTKPGVFYYTDKRTGVTLQAVS